MKFMKGLFANGLFLLATLFFCSNAFCGETSLSDLVNVQKYNRAIHIMAMLLVGFGFLMVFVKKYGRSAVTATYLLVSVALPMYILKDSLDLFGGLNIEIDKLILAQFSAASLLICAGAVLGRMRMWQYLLLGLLFVPVYSFNEWILLDNGMGIIGKGIFIDTGGSILIHAFGALFGLAVTVTMTTESEFNKNIEADYASDRFSLLGSMVLWLFWPSFCAAMVLPEMIPSTVINVILALSGATIATYFSSVVLRGKISTADIANATLAGGVAIGSTCDYASFGCSFVIGLTAGLVSTLGFYILQRKVELFLKGIDTCGVMNLHGIPGLLGGFSALFIVSDINCSAQLLGIGITIVVAIVGGYISGKVISLLGRKIRPYDDADEFICD